VCTTLRVFGDGYEEATATKVACKRSKGGVHNVVDSKFAEEREGLIVWSRRGGGWEGDVANDLCGNSCVAVCCSVGRRESLFTQFRAILFSIMWCSVLQCVALCVAVRGSVLQCVKGRMLVHTGSGTPVVQRGAVCCGMCCSVVQCVAVCVAVWCSVLRYVLQCMEVGVSVHTASSTPSLVVFL